MRVTILCILLAGCTGQPVTPDSVAPVTLVKAETVERSCPAWPSPPAELVAPMTLSLPRLAQDGELYVMTRAQVERMVAAYRTARARLRMWRASWAAVE